MSYSFTARADNAIKCTNTGFFKAGPVPPLPPTSYAIGDIKAGILFNPPTSTNLYTSSPLQPLSVIQYLDGYIYTWDAYQDATYAFGIDRRMHINGMSWGAGDAYEIKFTNTGVLNISSFVMGVNLMSATQNASDIGYGNDSKGFGEILLSGSTVAIKLGTNTTTVKSVNTNFLRTLPVGIPYTLVIKRELNDDLTVTLQKDSGTVFSNTLPFSSILNPAQSANTWSDINGIFISHYAKQLSSATNKILSLELRKL